MTQLATTRLGNAAVEISTIGFGAMHLALAGDDPAEDVRRVLHRVLDLGVTLIDTSDRYCRDESDPHRNEVQIADAINTYPGDTSAVCVATKGGMLRPHGMWVRFGKPDHIRRTIRESFEALGGERPIDLWQYHQLDLNYPLEETLAVAKQAVDEGLIRHVGVSNFNVEQIERARQIVEIVSVQNEYSLWSRHVERNGVLEHCEAEGLTFLAWRPLGGKNRAKAIHDNPALAQLAQEKSASPQQLALAWLNAQSSRLIPIPGSTRVENVEACVQSLAMSLDERDVQLLSNAVDEEPPSLRLTSS